MRISLVFALIIVWGLTNAQINDQLYFNHLTQAEGISQTSNFWIYKDSCGFVWISSINGLNRYDGQEIKVYKYNPFDSTSLADNNIQSQFVEDQNGNLWFTTYEGLVNYDRTRDNFKTFRFVKDSLVLKGYKLVLENKGDLIGLIINEKYFRLFDLYKESWISSPLLDTFPIETQQVFPLFDSRDSIESLITYAFDYPGLHFFGLNESGEKTHQVRFSGQNKEELELHFDDIYKVGDTLILGANEGFLIYFIKNSSWEFLPAAENPPNRFEQLRTGELLVSLRGGGWKITNLQNLETGKHIHHEPNNTYSLASNRINGVRSFNDGTIWTGVLGVGVDFTQPQKVKFEILDMAELFKFEDRIFNVYSMVENDDGNIWCASLGGGLFVLSPTLIPIDHFNTLNQGGKKLLNNGVFNIFLDNQERCWVFNYTGFGVIEKKNSEFEYSYVTDQVFLYGIKLQDGRVLFSSFEGVYQLNEPSGSYDFELIPQIDSINPYTHMYQSESGLLFLDKNISSILILDPENDFKPAGPELQIKGEVTCYYEEPNSSIIWIATKNGLVRLDPDNNWQWDIFTEEDGLPDQQIYSILGDKNNHLWLTTNRGMVRFDMDSLHFHTFSMYDGLQGLEYNTFSFMERSNGEFWFGGINGINYFHPDSIKYLDVLANPTITAIEINDEPSPDYLEDAMTKSINVSLINRIVLDHYQNDLSVKIAALEYSDPASNLYEFKMITGQDTIARKGKKSTFEYPNMQPGNYTLYYNASNSDGIWAMPKKLEILINPPWYERLWARILFAIAGLALIYAYYRYRIAQIRKEETFKRKEAEFRQKEAEYKQLVAETETAVLRLQMNPHFIFNSMNSINSYILKKDVDTASDYLNRFATLMRMILKFAAKKLIAVSDEIELLDLYLKTEAMRFEKKFNYSFELKDDLDPDEFLIPTMILQPFVENAIWHGLSSKKEGEGEIKICFWEEGESLLCSIADNGIGRQASRESSFKAKTHESKALSITEHRLQLLEKKNGVTASFEIQDLMDADQKPAGTKVVLRFPLF